MSRWQNLERIGYRRAYAAANLHNHLAFQVRAMRRAPGLSQAKLAELAGTKQGAIARLEDPNYGKATITTLLKVADVFDVWLSIDFVSFGEGLKRTDDVSEAALNAASFESDPERPLPSPPEIDR